MCRAVRCRTCNKTTWAGCGSHVASVRARVPADQWCTGHPKDAGRPAGQGERSPFRLFGRRTS